MKSRRTSGYRRATIMQKNVLCLCLTVFVILLAYLVVDNLFPPPCDNFYRRNPLMLVWRNIKPYRKQYFEQYETYLAEDIQKYQRKVIFEEITSLKQSVNNIFFIESTCTIKKNFKSFNTSKHFILNARQNCAVESTALANPESDVYIIYTCPLNNDFKFYLTNFSQKLFEYPNVHIVHTNWNKILFGTPAQQLINSKQKNPSQEFLREIMSITVLWRFGGTFFNWDLISIKSLRNLESNAVCVQDGEVQLARMEPGHDVLQRTLKRLGSRGSIPARPWARFTKFSLRNCQPAEANATLRRCESFTEYDPNVFYPIAQNGAEALFDQEIGWELTEALKRVSYVVHAWGLRSHALRVRVGSEQSYALLAHQFCPNVYRSCGSDM